MALDKQDIENLGWKQIKSVSPWKTYRYKTFLLSVYPNEIIISYITRYARTAIQLFKGKVNNADDLQKAMEKLKIV